MRESLDYLRSVARTGAENARRQWLPFALTLAILGGFYALSVLYPPGWLSWAACLPAALFLFLACLARVNDMSAEGCCTPSEHARRIGVVMVGAASLMFIGAPFLTDAFPRWRVVILLYGVALAAWPEVKDHADKAHARKDEAPRSPLDRAVGRVTGQFAALKDRRASPGRRREDRKP